MRCACCALRAVEPAMPPHDGQYRRGACGNAAVGSTGHLNRSVETRSRQEGGRAFSPGPPARRVEHADGGLAPRPCDGFVPFEAGEPRADVRQVGNELVRVRTFVVRRGRPVRPIVGHRRDDVAAGTSDAHEIDLRRGDPVRSADQLGVLREVNGNDRDPLTAAPLRPPPASPWRRAPGPARRPRGAKRISRNTASRRASAMMIVRSTSSLPRACF